MMLAVFLAMTGRVDRSAHLDAAHQPKPVELSMAFYTPGVGVMTEGMSARFPIRPNGWSVPAPYSQTWLEKFGWDDPCDEGKTPLPLPKYPLAALRGILSAANTVITFDAPEVDWGLRTWRAQITRRPDAASVFRERTVIIDTAKDAATAMGLDDRLPSFSEATEELLGEVRTGLDALLALFNHQGIQAVRRAA
ncbi:hypothetical protein L1787_05600 [Acuticoccus sp. M5D2P5]|uniref:hypothetical protein n=1 Tax=Acuticoccus kalidii TaxID=2910977 RepID=UPI001F2E07EE|nr:hypothetical protein [Acuticoccus kalidii]MCF3932888.1 hypothetical protein [Acuticoccus kalidii]